MPTGQYSSECSNITSTGINDIIALQKMIQYCKDESLTQKLELVAYLLNIALAELSIQLGKSLPMLE